MNFTFLGSLHSCHISHIKCSSWESSSFGHVGVLQSLVSVSDPLGVISNVGHQFTGHLTLPATRADAFLVPPSNRYAQVVEGCHVCRVQTRST
jgi:hypothetical protein